MFYKIDFKQLVELIVPPLLRRKTLLAFISVLIVPILYIYDRFLASKSKMLTAINTRANVCCLENHLCGLFFLKNREIFIEDEQQKETLYFYFIREKQVLPFINNNLIIRQEQEVSSKHQFVVNIPSFLCTSLNKEEDKFKGRYLSLIINVLNKYKPAGKSYKIKIYDI